MLSDGGRIGDIGKNFRSNNVLQVFAFIALQIQICFQNSVVYSGECQLNGNSLICERLSLVRIPLEVEGLQGVESLMVGSNLIGELKPHDITRLPQTLKKLDLTDNRLTKLNFKLLDAKLQDLRELVVSKNRMDAFLMSSKRNSSELIFLDLSYNLVESFRVESEFLKLQKLDLKFNKLAFLPSAAFGFLPDLRHLDLSGNPIHVIPDFSFADLKSLKVLLINFMPLLSKMEKQSLFSLTQLKLLEVRNNPRLETVDFLEEMSQLEHLDLSSNSMRHFTFPDDLGNLSFVDVSNNMLECDCFSLRSLQSLQIVGRKKKHFNLVGFSCIDPKTNDSYLTLKEAVEGLIEKKCPHSGFPSPSVLKPKIIAQIGESLLIGCPGLRDSDDVVWLTNRKETYARFSNDSSVDFDHFLNDSTLEAPNRFVVLSDGSLFIREVLTSDGGDFVCFSVDRNFTDFLPSFDSSLPHSVFSVKLDYAVLTRTSVASMIVGATTAGGFFVASAVLGAVRYAFNKCSRKEKRKKKSIREILEKMSGFKTTQMGRFSAYRNAKMDKLLAFKSATMDQLYAFKTARVDKLRTYKQATVTTILHHMDRMREHYAFQSSRIKDNCSQQVDKLRETYDTGCGRFKDYRSQRVEKMRENYNHQVCKIREYGQQQLSRLREQYKMQQQYLLKLLELIDVGNCITVIEAECLKTESVIFDADITFDLEPRPIRMPEPSECPTEDPGSEDGMMEEEDRAGLEEFLEELRSFGDDEDDGAVGGFGIDGCFCGVGYGDIGGRDDVGDEGINRADDLAGEASNLTLGKKMKKFKKKKIKKAVDASSSTPCPPITKDTKVKWSSRKKSKTTLHSSVPNYHLQTKLNQPTVAENTATPPPDQSVISAEVNDLDLRVSQAPHKDGVEADERRTSRDDPCCGNDHNSERPEFKGRRGDHSVQHFIIDCGEEQSSVININNNNTKAGIGTSNHSTTVHVDACSSGDDDDDDRDDLDDGDDRMVSVVVHRQQAI